MLLFQTNTPATRGSFFACLGQAASYDGYESCCDLRNKWRFLAWVFVSEKAAGQFVSHLLQTTQNLSSSATKCDTLYCVMMTIVASVQAWFGFCLSLHLYSGALQILTLCFYIYICLFSVDLLAFLFLWANNFWSFELVLLIFFSCFFPFFCCLTTN